MAERPGKRARAVCAADAVEVRWGTHPEDAKQYDTARLRREYVVENKQLFKEGEISWVYTMYDRAMTGGVIATQPVPLVTVDVIRSEYFLARREMGIFNVGGGNAVVKVEGETFTLGFKEALYVGKGRKEVVMSSADAANPAQLYMFSCPAHTTYPTKKVTTADSKKAKLCLELGSAETANRRTLNKMLVEGLVDTCQLQMGVTEIHEGSSWNTMPCHTHARRMEAYFYFELKPPHRVCHFMGEPQETRSLWISEKEAMAGENNGKASFDDMDHCQIPEIS